ncbi:MAG: hypothetical protein ACOH18_02895 [Candidatus Saccharimonadaceae bacterium]
MVRTISGSIVPTLTEAFGKNYRLKAAFNNAGFKTVVPIMMLPREALLEIPGIAVASAMRVAKTLKHYDLGQHIISERMSEFIESEFGRVRDAPIGVLQVTIVRSGDTNRPYFAPLDVIDMLEKIEPEMKIRQLLLMPAARILSDLEMHGARAAVRNPKEDFKHLAIRLGNFGLPSIVQQSLRQLSSVG